jgi:hypothetical protein
MTTFLRALTPTVSLHRDPTTGLAWAQWETQKPVQNPETFEVTGHVPHTVIHYAHPSASAAAAKSFQETESHGWKKSHRTVTGPDGRMVNISGAAHIRESFDAAVHAECQCGGVHAER